MTRLKAWLAADGAQAPMLVTGSSPLLTETVAALAQMPNIEMVTVPSGTPVITIEAVRALLSLLTRTSLTGKRLAVIAEAERLSGPAAQSLLKSLEEPTASTRYLLTSQYPRRLPLTILSRCQTMRLPTGQAGLPVPGRSGETGDDITALTEELIASFRRSGPTPAVRGAFMRLRDYYQIRHLRGNEKLAREVLFAYRPENKA